MKISEFKKLLYKTIRFRPVPIRRTLTGQVLGAFRWNRWTIQKVDEKKRVVHFKNTETGHSFDLGFDNIHSFQTPDFVLLNCSIIITGRSSGNGIRWAKILVEPIPPSKRIQK